MPSLENYARRYLADEIRAIQQGGQQHVTPELSLFEKAVIYKYSNDGYEGLNERLRRNGGQINMPFGRYLYRALGKLPDFNDLVYRVVRLSAAQLAFYQNCFNLNAPVQERTFLSTSKSRLVAMQYTGNALFRSTPRRGKTSRK